MRSENLFLAFSYIDDWYLDIADAPVRDEEPILQESSRHFTRKYFSVLLAAIICVSILAATAAAAGWLPGLFMTLKEKYPQDEALFEAAAQANTNAIPEIKEIPQADLSRLMLLERYFDGETILLGYDLQKVLPEPVVGIEPEEELLAKIRKSNRGSVITWDGVGTEEKKLHTKKAEQYNLTADAFAIDQAMQAALSEKEYEKAWDILEETGWVCIALRDVYIGDTILIDGHDLRETYNETNSYANRTEYESDMGNCLRLDPLPEEVKSSEKVTVTLTARSNVQYLYLDKNGVGRIYFDPDSVESEQISFELERTEKHG